MEVIKTTGKDYTYMCFVCGEKKVEPKKPTPVKWWERWLK